MSFTGIHNICSAVSHAASYFVLAEPKKWGEERGTPDNDGDDDHKWMEMGIIENGDSGEVVATQDTSGTESDDSAGSDLKTSGFIETNPLLQDERQKSPIDLHNSSVPSSGIACMSCRETCTLQKAKLYVVGKLKTGLLKLKEAGTVLRDRRVFLSITLYVMLSFSVIVGQEVSIPMLAYIFVLLLNAGHSSLHYNSYFRC